MPVLRYRKSEKWPLVWVPLALILSVSIYFAIKWGLKPKPIPQINPTQFASPEEAGALLYRRFHPILRQEKMVVLGSAPWVRDYERVWNGFLAAAREDKRKIDTLYEDPALRPIKDFLGMKRQPLAWPSLSPELAEDLKKHLQFGRLIVIHTTFNHSSYRAEDSLTKDLEKALRRPWTALSMLTFPVNAAELENLQPPCPDEVAPTTRGDYVACTSVRISRRFMRKKLDPRLNWLASERHGLGDYFVFIHQAVEQEAPSTTTDESPPQ